MKPSSKLGLCFSQVPSARFFLMREGNQPIYSEAVKWRICNEKHACGLVSAFQTQTLVKSTNIEAECGESEPAPAKYLTHGWRTKCQHKINSPPHLTSFPVTDPAIVLITPIAPELHTRPYSAYTFRHTCMIIAVPEDKSVTVRRGLYLLSHSFLLTARLEIWPAFLM